MLALGVIIVSRSRSFSGDLVRVLFGELLGIEPRDILVQLAATAVVLLATVICYRPFLLMCFSAEQAEVSGFSVRLYHGIMLAMIALTVIVSFRTVGSLLVFGLLIGPAATSALFTRRVGTMMVLAAGIGGGSVYVGLLASYHLSFAAGASVTLVATMVFFVSFAVVAVARRRSSRSVEGSLE